MSDEELARVLCDGSVPILLPLAMTLEVSASTTYFVASPMARPILSECCVCVCVCIQEGRREELCIHRRLQVGNELH